MADAGGLVVTLTEPGAASTQVSGEATNDQKPVLPHPVEELREQDRFLPVANISRIMKRDLPRNGKISKEAKECMQECTSEFISFVASEASDRCKQDKRKTITGDDIIHAMVTLGFDNYVEPMKILLAKCREYCKGPSDSNSASRDNERAASELSKDHTLFDPLSGGELLTNYQAYQTVAVTVVGRGNADSPGHQDILTSLEATTHDDLPVVDSLNSELKNYIILPPTQMSGDPYTTHNS